MSDYPHSTNDREVCRYCGQGISFRRQDEECETRMIDERWEEDSASGKCTHPRWRQYKDGCLDCGAWVATQTHSEDKG